MQMVFATQNHLNAVQVALVLCCNKKQFPLKLATFLLKVIEILIKSQAKVTTLQSGHEERMHKASISQITSLIKLNMHVILS